jgi:hypothetical protein
MDRSDSQYLLTLDNSKRSDYAKCPRKYYWRNERSLKPERGSVALLFGSTIHSMLEGYYKTIKEISWSEQELAITNAIIAGKGTWDEAQKEQTYYSDYRNLESACQLFLNYLTFHNYEIGTMNILGTETVFEHEIDLTGILFTGKIDLILEQNNAIWITDHKETSWNLSQSQTSLYRSAQLMGYTYAAKQGIPNTQINEDISGSQVNYLHFSARKNKAGTYGTPTTDFARIPLIFTDSDLQTWKDSFLDTAYKIIHSKRHEHWPAELDECYGKYGPCEYLPLCMQNKKLDDINTEGFIEIPWDVRGV